MNPGETLAHNNVTDKFGAGGMGDVLRATDTKLGREVALEFLPILFSSDPARLTRFCNEARALASIYGLEEAHE